MMKTILLIEDDLWLGDLYQDVLVAAGYRVALATDASQAAERLQEQLADLIVLDLMLPVHSGIALLHELRTYPDWAQIPVIIQSATDAEASGLSRAAWPAYGIVNYLVKSDARPQDLVRAVHRALSE